MKHPLIYRAPTEDDFAAMQLLDLELNLESDPTLLTLDSRERFERSCTSLAALRFFARSEHSFVAVQAPGMPEVSEMPKSLGMLWAFVLAQSVWQGDRPFVWISALRVHPGAPNSVLAGLLQACVKSAYDSAVYELHLTAEAPVISVALREGFSDTERRHLVRYLGSRANRQKLVSEGRSVGRSEPTGQ